MFIAKCDASNFITFDRVIDNDGWNRIQDVSDTICKTDAIWFVCAAVIILVLVFGAYGPGYDSADFIYNRF